MPFGWDICTTLYICSTEEALRIQQEESYFQESLNGE